MKCSEHGSGDHPARISWKAALAAVAVLAAMLLTASGAQAAWPPEVVSADLSYNNQTPQIALDASGNPNVVWYGYDDSDVRQIYYAEKTVSGWTPELVSTGSISIDNQRPQIALDSDGHPNVVWCGWDGLGVEQVYYAENTGSGWAPQLVSMGTTIDNQRPQIALDSDGYPNVVWSGNDGATSQIYYAENTGPGWTPQLVSTGTSTGNSQPQIAIDDSGNPNVAWYSYNSGPGMSLICYAENTGSGWAPQTVSTGDSMGYVQLALGPSGYPNVVWAASDGSTRQIYYSENTGSGWIPELVSIGIPPGDKGYTCLALDPSGSPHVTWQGRNGPLVYLYYAEKGVSGWAAQEVPTPEVNVQHPDLAVDSSGHPKVVWESNEWHVYYSENTGDGWITRVVAGDTPYGYPQIALDALATPNLVWVKVDDYGYQIFYSEFVKTAPVVTSTAPTTVTSTTADPGGNVTDDGGDPVTARGVCYGTSADPDIDGPHQAALAGGTGSFTVTLDTLTPGQTYHIRAYATNSVGTAYGEDLTFTTLDKPTLSTTAPTTVTSTTADPGGNVTDDGGDPVTARGVCYGASADPDIDGPHKADIAGGTGSFTVTLDTLTPGQTYHIRAYATNSVGTAYGEDRTFTTLDLPVVTTAATSNVTSTTASSGGNVTGDGGDPVTARGVCWSTSPDPTVAGSKTSDGTGTGAFTSSITGLSPSTAYHVRAYATNSVGTAYGEDRTFTTLDLPVVTTTAPINIASTTADSGGNVTDDGGALVTARGVCWSTNQNPTIAVSHTSDGSGTGTFTSNISGLTPNTRYYIRAYATNSVGTVYGDQREFTTINGTGSSWYLAEGTNTWGFSTYITIENPNNKLVAAKLTYMDPNPPAAGKGVLKSRTITLPALSQTTVSSYPEIGAVDFSTKVECLQGETIAVDRTMFWTGQGITLRGYHSSVGTSIPSKTWYLPEGSSAWGFETWTLVLNPNNSPAVITLTYMTETGPVAVHKTIPADSRASWNMASDIGVADASIKVESDLPVVAERSMYNANRREGSCSIGATTPATDFFLSEGAMGYSAGFVTWVLVENPNETDNTVSLTFQTGTGQVAGPTFTMPANSRKTVRLNDLVPANTDVSTLVHGSKPLVAERAMYWDAGTGLCFHASIGLSEPHMSFMCPDGQVGEALTYTLVQNPNPGAVRVRITYLPQNGGKVTGFTAEIPAGSRATFNMADRIKSGRAAILVESLDGARPIMVERSMYGADWGSGDNTIGAFED